jgi:hypothetical protein
MLRTARASYYGPLTFVAVLVTSACGGAVAPQAAGSTAGSGPGSSASSGGAGAPGAAPTAGGSGGSGGSGTAPPSTPPSSGSSSAPPPIAIVDAGAPPATCTNLGMPQLAMTCPDGTTVGPAYSIQNGQCSLVYPCPRSSAPAVDASAPPLAPTPLAPSCNFALPDLCEVCADGETLCAHYAIVGNQCMTEICPPPMAPPPPVPPCATPGAACNGFSGCGELSSQTGCMGFCNCDSTGHYQCTSSCPPTPPVARPVAVPCAAGNVCSPGLIACSSTANVGAGACTTNCNCGTSGTLVCTTTCGDAGG